MSKSDYNREDPICALATAWSQSALGIIRCSGPGVVERLDTIFHSSRPLSEWEPNFSGLGKLKDPRNGEVLDEVMAVVFRAPKSYTGQDSVEFSCHGSLPGLERILQTLHRQGIREAAPGEFTYRAFLNGKMDLTQAEAVQEIVSSRTAEAQSLALNRLSGVIHREIEGIKEQIMGISAHLALALDYPEDEVEIPELPTAGINEAARRIEAMLGSYQRGRLYQEGVTLALAGRTNAGKSSLYNLILKEERSIVSQIHGTTRDYLETTVTLKGIPLRIFDTAGLRDSEDPVEQEGIRRSNQIVDNAQILLLVLDSQEGFSPVEQDFYEKHKKKALLVWNKVDLETPTEVLPPGALPVSAFTGEGFPALEEAVAERIFRDAGTASSPVVIDSLRQKELLEQALEGLDHFRRGLREQLPLDILSEDIRDSLNALGEITGEISSADILEKLFSDFCVGK